MKSCFVKFFLAVLLFAFYSCKKESKPSNAEPLVVLQESCSKSNNELEGKVHGHPWKVQSSSGRVRYYSQSDSSKTGLIKEIELRLYDTLYNACERLASPRLTPIVQLTLPPKLGTYSTDSFPFYPIVIFYNDTVTTSYNSISKGCVIVENIDTNSSGHIKFHLDTKVLNEYWDQQGNVLRKDSSILKGMYSVNFCQ